MEGLAERCQENCPHSEKVLGREGLDCDKIEEYPGLCWKILRSWHWGHAAVEQLRGWSDTFLQFDCLYRICRDKREESIWELCSKEKGQDSTQSLRFSQATEKISGVVEAYPHTVQWAHRETHSIIKILAPLGPHLRLGHSATWAHSGLRLLEGESKAWRGAARTLGWLPEEFSSQAAHRPTTQFL